MGKLKKQLKEHWEATKKERARTHTRKLFENANNTRVKK